MKLYTEESLKCTFDKARAVNNSDYGDYTYDSFDEIKYDGELTPIELPSDEEIEKAANSQSHYEGAMWLKYKILNQNK